MTKQKIARHSSRKAWGLVVGAASVLFAADAAAQPTVTVTVGEPPPPPPPPPPATVVVEVPESIVRWGGGFRFSYGVPGGSIFNGQSLSGAASGLVHFEGQGDLVILRRLALGANVGVGLGLIGDGFGDGCQASGSSCSVFDLDVGLHAEYRILPDGQVNPWVGLGVEYEILLLSSSYGGNDTSGNFGGADVDFSAGVDFQYRNLGIGPFLTYRFGTYASASETLNGVDVDSGDLRETASHDWFMLGLRGRY